MSLLHARQSMIVCCCALCTASDYSARCILMCFALMKGTDVFIISTLKIECDDAATCAWFACALCFSISILTLNTFFKQNSLIVQTLKIKCNVADTHKSEACAVCCSVFLLTVANVLNRIFK